MTLATIEPSADDGESGGNEHTRSDTVVGGLQGLVGAVMILSGGTKLAGVEGQVEEFERYGYPQWFRVTTGGMEIGGALRLIGGLHRPVLALPSGALVLVTMIGAAATHLLRVRDPPAKAMPATVFLVLTAIVTGVRAGAVDDELEVTGGN